MIIGSLTTMPHRISACKDIIDSILKTGIDWLEFNIPEYSVRTKQEYIIPEWLENMPNVKIFRTPDYGPLTKVLPTFQRHQNSTGYIITFDDDTVYLPGLVERYRPFLGNDVVGSYGGLVDGYKWQAKLGQKATFLYGYGSTVYPMNIFKDDLKYFLETNKNSDCFQSDDIILSNFAYKKGRKCVVVFERKFAVNCQLLTGIQDPLGLCNQGNTGRKIVACIRHLQSIGECHLHIVPKVYSRFIK